MNIGDIRWETPTFGSAPGIASTGPQRCRVVRIHPEERFYTVEFQNELGQTFRESYYFSARRGNPGASEEIPRENRDRGRFGDPRRLAEARRLPSKGEALYQF